MSSTKYFLIALLVIMVGSLKAQEQEPAKPLELNFHLAPAITLIKSNTFGSEEKANTGFAGGADLTYYFKTVNKIKVGVSAGLNYSFYKTTRNLNYNDSVLTTDIDNEQVHLFEQGNNLEEVQKISFIDIPLLLHFNYTLSPKLEANLKLGPYLSFVAGNSFTSTTIYTSKGYYPKFNALVYNVDVDDSPYFYPTQKPISDHGKLKLKGNMGLEIGLGLKYRLNPKYTISVGVSSYMGLKNLSDYPGEQKALVNSDRSINSVMKRLDKINAKAYCLELGFAFYL